ncbi:cation:proton antiporter [Candidatus Woesearchaeota archaeon]|nr:cation:proton antiporter [Candidatus Woesearchaeota archaeon]
MNALLQLAPKIGNMLIGAHTNDVFFEIGLILIIATLFAFIAKKLKQPMIPAYIITGLLIGPLYGLITNKELITTLSEIGIAFLLFIVGLEMDLKKLKNVAVVSGLGGTIKSVSMFSIGFIISLILGFTSMEAAYIGIIIAFSSTMIVVKLISDKKGLDTLHGRIIVGILLMEDILAILALSILTSLGGNSFVAVVLALFKGGLLLLAALALTNFIFPSVFKTAAKSQELLFLVSISACFLLSIAAYYLKFSIAIGAFLAGLSLANLPYNFAIIGRVRPLRDFFATIFFVSLGMNLMLNQITSILPLLFILITLAILIKPLITMFLCSFFGYKRRVSFMASISLAQISEFSLIIVSQGMMLGHVSGSIFTLTILVAIITMVITSYFIKFENSLYSRFRGLLRPFDRLTEGYEQLEYLPRKRKTEVILIGHNRIGYSISKTIKNMGKKMLVIDYNPEILKMLIRKKISCLYGDAGDIDLLERLPFDEAKIVISTIPSSKVNKLIIEKARQSNKDAVIYVTSSEVGKALNLYASGADYVILPHFLGGEHVSTLIEKFSNNSRKVVENKLSHIRELKHRKSIGHEHPNHHTNSL